MNHKLSSAQRRRLARQHAKAFKGLKVAFRETHNYNVEAFTRRLTRDDRR
jgi:hypothetical protein